MSKRTKAELEDQADAINKLQSILEDAPQDYQHYREIYIIVRTTFGGYRHCEVFTILEGKPYNITYLTRRATFMRHMLTFILCQVGGMDAQHEIAQALSVATGFTIVGKEL